MLVDKHMRKMTVYSRVDIILTPSLYWIKRAYFEVHFVSQALKYAPSVFEGILPEGNYAYFAVKTKKEYLMFAYDPDVIIATLAEHGIQSSQIGDVYFAQNEFADITVPLRCNENDVLVLHDDTILQVPESLVDESTIQDEMDEIKHLSKHKVTLYKSSIRHSFKELAPVMSVLGGLILLYTTQLFFTYQQKAKVDALPSVFQEYKLPSTSIQNASIEKKLLNDFKAQKSFRQLTNAILTLPLSAAERIESISYEKELYKIVFEGQGQKGLSEIALHLEKSLGKLVKVEVEKNMMRIQIL